MLPVPENEAWETGNDPELRCADETMVKQGQVRQSLLKTGKHFETKGTHKGRTGFVLIQRDKLPALKIKTVIQDYSD